MRVFRTTALALVMGLSLLPATSVAPQAAVMVGISVSVAPPPLPVYVQPAIPGPGYHWIPGYWAYGDDDYYWVPGYWARPPRIGLLWTPGYWGWNNGAYVFNEGYWGTHVGFYGGVVYGFGYTGTGFEGGYWRGRNFYYNRSVTNVSVNITNVYNKTVIVNNNVRTSFNGGTGGIVARPTPAQLAVAKGPHVAPTPVQLDHVKASAGDKALRAKANNGAPPVTAIAHPQGQGQADPAHALPTGGAHTGAGAAAVGAAAVGAAGAAHLAKGAHPAATTGVPATGAATGTPATGAKPAGLVGKPAGLAGKPAPLAQKPLVATKPAITHAAKPAAHPAAHPAPVRVARPPVAHVAPQHVARPPVAHAAPHAQARPARKFPNQ